MTAADATIPSDRGTPTMPPDPLPTVRTPGDLLVALGMLIEEHTLPGVWGLEKYGASLFDVVLTDATRFRLTIAPIPSRHGEEKWFVHHVGGCSCHPSPSVARIAAASAREAVEGWAGRQPGAGIGTGDETVAISHSAESAGDHWRIEWRTEGGGFFTCTSQIEAGRHIPTPAELEAKRREKAAHVGSERPVPGATPRLRAPRPPLHSRPEGGQWVTT